MSNSRFSIMGSNDGPLSRKIEYYGREHEVSHQGLRVIHSNYHRSDEFERVAVDEVDMDILSYLRQRLVDHGEFVDYAEIITFDDSSVHNATTTTGNSTDLGYKSQRMDEFNQEGSDDTIPFEYRGGYVGYLGYEVRHDTQCRIFEREGGAGCNVVNVGTSTSTTTSPSTLLKTNPNIPTASFLFVDRSLLYDHQAGDWYMIGIIENHPPEHEDRVGGIVSWMKSIESRIKSLGQDQDQVIVKSIHPNAGSNNIKEVTFIPKKSIIQYQNDIARSYREIRNGESYELCLTNQFEAEIRLPKKHASPFELYKLLRKRNPAPFSSFMNLYNDRRDELSSSSSQKNTASVSICCSSPERFLSVTRSQSTVSLHTSYGAGYSDQYRRPRRQFVVESKPIKGTKARYSGTTTDGVVESDEYIKLIDSQIAIELSESVKDRAENLMIVDLLRNDLGRVCQVGSVHVPKLMQIESYATVHQMVSTVRGTLDGDTTNVIDVIEACFPGGSMTGAPKQRSMEILNDIEEGVSRGPYSGCLGYISLNGSMDMNIVIRSAILTPMDKTNDDMEEWKVSVGCGGAITALSDSDDEYDEMLLKSRIVRSAISDWVAQATEDVVGI
jgi:para-aminobenzoate synthetase